MKSTLLKIYYEMLKVFESIIKLQNKILSLTVKPPIVMTTEDTLLELAKGKVSISRFGDGEFALMNGEDLLFQPYDSMLKKRLQEILKSNQDKHLVGIPNVFLNLDWCTNQARAYWAKYLNLNRNKIYKQLDLKKKYYDSLVTRLYIDREDKEKAKKYYIQVKQLWSNRRIVIVEGGQSRVGIGNDLFEGAASIERVICPSINAFEKYKEILDEVCDHSKSKLILIALGPTATVLAYDLARMGYQAIDIGHIDIEYEWYLRGAQEKETVEYKYIGEIPNGDNVKEMVSVEYEKEIIRKIV